MGLIENIYHVAKGEMSLSHIFDGLVVYPAAGALGGCASDTAVQKGSAEPTGALYAEGLSPEMLGQSVEQPDASAPTSQQPDTGVQGDASSTSESSDIYQMCSERGKWFAHSLDKGLRHGPRKLDPTNLVKKQTQDLIQDCVNACSDPASSSVCDCVKKAPKGDDNIDMYLMDCFIKK
ncbi:MAG: hypothetical protein WC956_05980 [bacterium]